jgi:hypothetical protein
MNDENEFAEPAGQAVDMYRGRPVETMTREELIQALHEMAHLRRTVIENHARELMVLEES